MILTTSPPNSTHLIGEAIAAATRTPWVADFRDPWLSHPHRHYERAGVRAKRAVERHMARSVVRRAAAVTAVTEAIADEARGLDARAAARTTVIPNGSDFDDFEGLALHARRTVRDRARRRLLRSAHPAAGALGCGRADRPPAGAA